MIYKKTEDPKIRSLLNASRITFRTSENTYSLFIIRFRFEN